MKQLATLAFLLCNSGCDRYRTLHTTMLSDEACSGASCCGEVESVWATTLDETLERMPEAYFIPDDPGPIFEPIDFEKRAVLMATLGGCEEGVRLRLRTLRWDASESSLHGVLKTYNAGDNGQLLGARAIVFVETPREWVGPVDFELMR